MNIRSYSVLTAAVAITALSATAHAQTPSADSTATSKLQDLSATLVVVDAETNFEELKKIGGSFATTYRFKRMDVRYKNPDKIRLEAKVSGISALMVFNGHTKMVKVPFKKDIRNVRQDPGQKQTLMDLGVFSKDYLASAYSPTYLRTEGSLQVYKLTQRNTDSRSHEVVWVNPKTSLIERRLSLNAENKIRKEMRFKNPLQVRPGIWVPRRIEVYNQFGKLGAVQTLEDIKVNLGVDDNQFHIS